MARVVFDPRLIPRLGSLGKVRDSLLLVWRVNQDTRFGRFNSVMSNLESHFPRDLRPRQSDAAPRLGLKKWSGRRTIGICLLVSGLLWVGIFFAAKALIG
jgi:hypothetical protein